MSCTDPARELVTFWLAGSLTPAEAALVDGHVATCVDCREAALEGAALVKGFRALHLQADEVVRAAAGDLHAPHLLVCSRCREEVALLRAVNADLAPGKGRAVWTRRSWIGLAAAAAVLLLVVWIGPTREAGDAALRGGRSKAVELLSATTTADGVPTFKWKPLAAATGYRVTVFSTDGRPVWTRDVVAPPTRWPADVLRTPGAYRWWIEALNAKVVIARSRLAEFEVSR